MGGGVSCGIQPSHWFLFGHSMLFLAKVQQSLLSLDAIFFVYVGDTKARIGGVCVAYPPPFHSTEHTDIDQPNFYKKKKHFVCNQENWWTRVVYFLPFFYFQMTAEQLFFFVICCVVVVVGLWLPSSKNG